MVRRGVVAETRRRAVSDERVDQVEAVAIQNDQYVRRVEKYEKRQTHQAHQIILAYLSPFQVQESLAQRMLEQFVLAFFLETFKQIDFAERVAVQQILEPELYLRAAFEPVRPAGRDRAVQLLGHGRHARRNFPHDHVQRRYAAVRLHAHVAALGQQRLDALRHLTEGRYVQWREPVPILHVDFGLVAE